MTTLEVRFAGKGGQGIVFSGLVLARSAVIYEGKNATSIQSYGSRMRGGSTVSDVIISDDEILCPVITEPDVLVALAEEPLKEFSANVKEDGFILVDNAIKLSLKGNFKVFIIPATQTAESDFGSRTPANVIMLGALVGITDIVSEEAILTSLLDVMEELDLGENVKKRNIQALIRGIELGRGLNQHKAD